jgi:hypothetical protein
MALAGFGAHVRLAFQLTDDPLTPEEADPRERLQAQVLQRPEDE